jgi:hypothetical protein
LHLSTAAATVAGDQGGTPVQTEPKYWFPAKRYGWGWGIPNAWQGWLVLAAFVGLLVVGSVVLPPGRQLGPYLAYVAVLCGLLIAVCWLKGEPPRWRWGGDKSA